MLVGWSATRMGGMLTRVARWLAMMNGTPSDAIGALEEVAACCVTVLGACACRQVHRFAKLCPTPTALWLDSEDATYMVALAAVR